MHTFNLSMKIITSFRHYDPLSSSLYSSRTFISLCSISCIRFRLLYLLLLFIFVYMFFPLFCLHQNNSGKCCSLFAERGHLSATESSASLRECNITYRARIFFLKFSSVTAEKFTSIQQAKKYCLLGCDAVHSGRY